MDAVYSISPLVIVSVFFVLFLSTTVYAAMSDRRRARQSPDDWAELFWSDEWYPSVVPDGWRGVNDAEYLDAVRERAAEFLKKFPNCPLSPSRLLHEYVARD